MPTIKNLTEDTAAVVWIQENDCCCIPCGIKFLTEAEARAAMLIYLLENNLTTAEEVNQRLTN